jgi:DNA-binding NarL/FixJ family response regulator
MVEERFISLATVQRELSLTDEQVLSLVTSGDLPAIRLLGAWRVERQVFEQFISLAYEKAAHIIHSSKPEGGLGRADSPIVHSAELVGVSEGRRTASSGLTEQMQRVLRLVAQGYSNAEVARELCVEVSTAKSHVSRLLTRFGVRDRAGLIALAWRLGIVNNES